MAKSKSHRYQKRQKPKNHNAQARSKQVQDIQKEPDMQSVQNVRNFQSANNGVPKKSMALRILVIVVAVLMFAGAIAVPFMSLFRN